MKTRTRGHVNVVALSVIAIPKCGCSLLSPVGQQRIDLALLWLEIEHFGPQIATCIWGGLTLSVKLSSLSIQAGRSLFVCSCLVHMLGSRLLRCRVRHLLLLLQLNSDLRLSIL